MCGGVSGRCAPADVEPQPWWVRYTSIPPVPYRVRRWPLTAHPSRCPACRRGSANWTDTGRSALVAGTTPHAPQRPSVSGLKDQRGRTSKQAASLSAGVSAGPFRGSNRFNARTDGLVRRTGWTLKAGRAMVKDL